MLSAFAFEARAEIATNGFIIATEADEGKAITVEELDASVVNASYKGNSNYKVVIPSGTTTIYVKFSSNTFSDATAYVGDYANTAAKRCISQSYKDTLTAKYKTPPGSIIAGQYTVSSNYQNGWYAMPLTDLTATASIYPGIAFNSALNYACAMIWQLADNATVPAVNKAVNVLIQIGESGGNSLTDEQTEPLTSLLASVTGENEANWYQTDDCYNGNGYKSSGFWTAFTAKDGPREQAQKALASAKSPEDIEAARAALQAEIDQLIPADRLNTTPLYEALQRVNSLGYNDLSLKAYTETSAAKFKEGRAEAQAYLDSLFTGEDGNRKPSDANKKENQTTFDTAVTKARELPTLLVHQSLVSYSEQNTKTIQALAARYGAGENPGYTEESWLALQSARTDALAYIKAHPVTDRLTKDENRGLREKANTLWNAICALKSTKEQISVTLTYTDDYHLRLPSSKLADKSGLTPGSKNYELTSDSTLRDLFATAGFTSPNGGSASDKYPGLDSDADALRRYGWSIRVNGVQQTTGLIGDQAITNFMGQLLHDGDQVQIALFEVPTRAFNYIYREELDYWGQLPGVLGSLRFAGGSSTSAEAGAELSLTVEGAKTAHLWSYNGSYAPYEGAKIAVYGPKTEAGYARRCLRLPA